MAIGQEHSLRKVPKFDPILFLPEDVISIIFGFLTFKDMLALSLASKMWYEMIGRSLVCMKKMFLKISIDRNNPDNFNIVDRLMNSSRQYQNIELRCYRFWNKPLTSFENKALGKIFKKFSESIVFMETSHDFQRLCQLPKLRKVVLTCEHQSLYSNGILSTIKHVEALEVNRHFHKVSEKHLARTIGSMTRLKVLKVYSPILSLIKSEECEFLLRELCIHADHYSGEKPNLWKFLNAQKSSLQILSVQGTVLDADELNSILTQMPNLKELGLIHYCESQIDIPTFHNESINTLKLGSSYEEIMLQHIHSFKKLKVLEIYKIKLSFVRHIVQHQSIVKVIFTYICSDIGYPLRTSMKNYRRIEFVSKYNPNYHIENNP